MTTKIPKLYLIETDTGSQWQMCGGIFIISANSKTEAIETFNSSPDFDPSGKITSCVIIKPTTKPKIIFSQHAVIE